MSSRQLAGQLCAYAIRCTGDDDVGHLETHPQLIGHALRKAGLQVETEYPSQGAAGDQPSP
jgi:hypothetical protein